MKRVLALSLFVLLIIGSAPTTAHAALNEVVTYNGFAVDEQRNPFNGAHDLELRYFTIGDTTPLYRENFEAVPIKDGHFQVMLGQGQTGSDTASADLKDVFTQHPELSLEIRIGSTLLSPRIRILPAGHSIETRAMLSGAVSEDDEAHTKGYRAKNKRTAIQAVDLVPAKTARETPYSATHKSNPFLIDMDFLGVSEALRDMLHYEPQRQSKGDAPGREVNPLRHEDIFDRDGYRYGTRTEKIDDPLAAESQRSSGRATPGMIVDFEGISATGVAPPDTEGAVGPNHYIQVVNSAFRIYDKTGTPLTSLAQTNSLWSGAGGSCETNNSGDAIFLYDEQADRWVLTQFTLLAANAVCFAVSTTGDPTGTYYRYQFDAVRYPDYYKLGVWPDPGNNAYFMGTNTGAGGQYDIYAVDRANLIAGTTPRPVQYFQNHPNLLMPADLDGDNLPPTGTPGIFYTFRDGGESYFVPSSAIDTLDIWEFNVDWATPASSTFTLVQGIVPPELADFNWTICGFFNSDCLVQPGTSQKIDSASWWPMQRLQYRNFGSYETLVSSWTVDVLASGDHAAPRWFELRRTGGAWSMAFQGTLAPDSKHRWMPSAALDGSGNMAMGYSVLEASSTTYAGLRYATRTANSPTFDTEATQINGGGYVTGVNRWGDYASMEVDPSDDCTFWFTSEYIASSGSYTWNTRISSFKVPGCSGSVGLVATPPTRELCSSVGSTTYDITLSSPFTATTNLSVTGCPSGATCTFSPNPVVNPVAASILTISGLAGVAANTYTLAVTATDSVTPATTMSSNVYLTVYAGNPAAPSLTSPADGATGVSTTPTLAWSAVSDASSYELQVATDAGFTNIVATGIALTGTSHTLTSSLASNTMHFWRLRSVNDCGSSAFSAASDFTTVNTICFTAGVSIPDGSSSGVDDTGIVANSGTLTDLDVSIDISHTWVGDLVVTLTNESTGASVILIDQPGVPADTYGCSGDNISAVLDDEAGNPVEDECGSNPAISGTLIPNNLLSGFDGLELNGSWTLNVADVVGSFTGTFDSWCLLPSVESAPVQAIFSDGFESGNTSAWSSVIP